MGLGGFRVQGLGFRVKGVGFDSYLMLRGVCSLLMFFMEHSSNAILHLHLILFLGIKAPIVVEVQSYITIFAIWLQTKSTSRRARHTCSSYSGLKGFPAWTLRPCASFAHRHKLLLYCA